MLANFGPKRTVVRAHRLRAPPICAASRYRITADRVAFEHTQ
jgi:hypothetical protein